MIFIGEKTSFLKPIKLRTFPVLLKAILTLLTAVVLMASNLLIKELIKGAKLRKEVR